MTETGQGRQSKGFVGRTTAVATISGGAQPSVYHDRGPHAFGSVFGSSSADTDTVGPTEDGHRVREDRFVLVAGSQLPLPALFVANDTSNKATRDDNDESGGGDEQRHRIAATVIDTETSGLNTDLRRINHKKINRNDYFKSKMDKMVVEEGVSTGYQNAYDFTHNYGGYGLKENDNPETLWSGYIGESSNWDQFPYRIRDQHPAASHRYNGYTYKAPPNSPTKYYRKPIQHKENIIDWQKISILALVKLGLAKLQAISFLKILFFLAFKFILFMKAIIFKFLLAMKKIKFFNILALPLFIIKLLPIFMQLLSMMGQLYDINRTPVNNILAYPEFNALQTSALSGLLSSRPSGLLPSQRGTNGDGITGTTSGMDLTGGTNDNKPAGTISSSLNLNDLHTINTQYYQPLKSFDPTLNIFQKVLDSEKCIERIACRIVYAEKAGIMPFWINWMLNCMSKFISNKKLESYLKIYKDVNNEIRNKSLTTDNWATWCSEHYNCSSNNTSNLK